MCGRERRGARRSSERAHHDERTNTALSRSSLVFSSTRHSNVIKIIPGHPHHSFAAAAAAGAAAAFVPFIIPYVIKSQSNARCMRSNVTISRIVLYQIRGPREHHRPRVPNADPDAVPPTPYRLLHPVRAPDRGHRAGALHQPDVLLDRHEVRVRPLLVQKLEVRLLLVGERRRRLALRVVPYKAMAGWSSKASGGVQRRRGRGLNARDGRRDAPGKVLKE